MLGAVLTVLLIGCTNLAALSLARATARQHEMAIKKALGATSTRLALQLSCESLILAVAGGLGGIVLAAWGVREGIVSGAGRQRFEVGEALAALWAAKWELALPAVVLVSMFSGIANAAIASSQVSGSPSKIAKTPRVSH